MVVFGRPLILGILILGFAARSGLAQPNVLSLDDCIRLAISAQSTLTVAQRDADIARYGLIQARNNFLPQTRFNNAFVYNSPQIGNSQNFSFVQANGIHEYLSQFTAVQELDTSGRLRAGLARAKADRDAAQANLTIAGRDLKRAVKLAYFDVLFKRHLVDVYKASLGEAQSFESRTKLLLQGGEAAQADVVKASSEVAFLQQTVSDAELQASIANQDLAAFWTTDVATILALTDVFGQPVSAPEPTPAATAVPLFMSRPEFNFFDAQRRGAVADTQRARADLMPQLNFVFAYGIDSLRLSIKDRGYLAGFNLSIPLFDWFRNRSTTQQFNVRTQQVDINRTIATRSFSRDYQNALSRVRQIYSQIALTDSQVQLSEDNLRLSRVRYEGGEGSALDVVSAQTQLAQARTNYYTVLANYFNARADLEVASGQ